MTNLSELLKELEEINEEWKQGGLTEQRAEYLQLRKSEIEELLRHANTLNSSK